MQAGLSFTRRTFPKSVLFGFLLLTLVVLSIAVVPQSDASRNTVSAPQAATASKRSRREFVPGEVLVRFKKDRALDGLQSVAVPNNSLEARGLSQKTPEGAVAQEQMPIQVDRFAGSDLVEGLRLAHVNPNDTLKAIAALNARNDVLYAEPNYIIHVDATPNDPLYGSGMLYGLNKIGGPQAWDITTGSPSIVVGVVDEGVDVGHSDLQANIFVNPAPGSIPGISGDVNGYDFRNNTGTIPAEGHGTHVAGTIGAVGNNGVGVVGVNWQVKLMSLRFIDEAAGQGDEADAIRAYAYAKQMRDLWVSSNHASGANIRVLNASFGDQNFVQAAADAISALNQSGILLVAAAGNFPNTVPADNDAGNQYPADYELPNIISVAATDQNDNLASFSHFGLNSVTMGAPGVGITSTFPNGGTGTYGVLSGTSMATPHVAGAAALLSAANSNLSVAQVRALLMLNGDVVPALQGKTITGRRLNVFKSLQALGENDAIPPGAVTNLQITSQTGRNVNLSWSASGDDGSSGQAALYQISFVDGTTSAVLPMVSVVPVLSGNTQTVNIKLPFRHTAGTIRLREFDNAGNEGTPVNIPVTVHPNFSDPYTTTLNSPAALSTGGTALGLTSDDCYRQNFNLPFAFSYFGQLQTKVTISTNGNLYFSQPPLLSKPCTTTDEGGNAADSSSNTVDLNQIKMIAGLWDDLDLRQSRRADADVYVVQPDATRIIFRWQGVKFDDGSPVNFEIELVADGRIITRYGAGNVNMLPVVGLSGGEREPYIIDALTSENSPKTLTNAQSAVFAPRANIQLSAATYSVTEAAQAHVDIVLTRTGDTTSSASVSFTSSDTAGPNNCSLLTGIASSRCDYITSIGTVQFAAGETSKTIPILIIDDSYNEGSETFKVGIDNALGAAVGAQISATVTISDNADANGPNPIDQTSFFVRQHYLDFLNREPDPGGLAFWTGEIDNCTPKPQCTEEKRINVSAAFFLSIEFQETGYLVERLYKCAYGSFNGTSTLGGTTHTVVVPIVRLLEFLPDSQKIGKGVVVGAPGWEAVLEQNKQAFLDEFVQRTRFTDIYPVFSSANAYVNLLNANAGNPLTLAERDQLIADMDSGLKSRAQVLRAVAEHPVLVTSEKNRAFVLMQYFGYLRRNPNDAPDPDHTGYEFWLNKLNQFGGNFVSAEMVKAFIQSTEYRQRFGPPN